MTHVLNLLDYLMKKNLFSDINVYQMVNMIIYLMKEEGDTKDDII